MFLMSFLCDWIFCSYGCHRLWRLPDFDIFILILQAWTNLIHRARFFGFAVLLVCPTRHAKNVHAKPKNASNGEKAGNIAFCFLLPKQVWSLSFSRYFQNFCYETFVVSGSWLNIVLMSEIRSLSKNNFHTSESPVYRCLGKYAESM